MVLDGLRKSVGDHDGVAVEKASHRLKCNVRNFYSEKLAALALSVEEAGRSLNFQDLMTKVDELEVGLKDLERDLQQSLIQLQAENT